MPACSLVAPVGPRPVPPRPYWGRSARPVRPGRPVPLDLTHGPPRPVRPVPSLGPTGAVSRPARAVSPPLGPSIRAVIRYLPAPENAAFGKYGGRPVRLSYVRPSPVPSRAFRLSRSGPRFPCLYVVGRLPSVRRCFGTFTVLLIKSLCRYFYPLYYRIEACIPRVRHSHTFTFICITTTKPCQFTILAGYFYYVVETTFVSWPVYRPSLPD